MKQRELKCDRCGGVMSFENFENITTEGNYWTFEGWRCLDCGEIVDPMILFNRERSEKEEALAVGEKR